MNETDMSKTNKPGDLVLQDIVIPAGTVFHEVSMVMVGETLVP